ncbi:hypothetical protein FZ041_03285 [Selenomonas caprae]|uniref:Sulfotransferase n=1 Tax=Selenomonas caprae TaxID=2606905 RepID=A0A5D6WRL4_9FIRM|nr:hypothetical protein [Selenomonas caprae]TYZ29952.1 hypothetical protein FZ041_03285 [Selenomonas caprae]
MSINKRCYVPVLGYGWSGSSAVVDFLREFSVTWEPGIEFRLIKDPCGLMDLKYNIIDRWEPLNVDVAIKNFLWFAYHLSVQSGRFKLVNGLGYESVWGDKFLEITNDFIKRLSPFQYDSNWHYLEFQKSKSTILYNKIKHKLWPASRNIMPKLFYAQCEEEEFCRWCREYIDSLMACIVSEDKNYIILDQAVPVQNIEVAKDYFSEYKVIVAERDPRDQYVDLIDSNMLIGADIKKTHDVKKFIDWFLPYRKNQHRFKKMENVKFICFEQLVLDYEKTSNEIMDFLGLEESQHIGKQTRFKPEISAKNIGLWKKYPYQDEIKYIEEKLQAYIHD